MYLSSVLDHCTLYPESHMFSHCSYCNQPIRLFICICCFPLANQHQAFFHCSVCTYSTHFVSNFSFRSLHRTSQLFFPSPRHTSFVWLLRSLIVTVLHEVPFYIFAICDVKHFLSLFSINGLRICVAGDNPSIPH